VTLSRQRHCWSTGSNSASEACLQRCAARIHFYFTIMPFSSPGVSSPWRSKVCHGWLYLFKSHI